MSSATTDEFFPKDRTTSPFPVSSDSGPSKAEESPFAGHKILVVDDERINNVMMSRVLKRAKFEVIVATTGEEALEKYAAESPDLVLLDVMLPGIDGYETCRQLKQTYGQEAVPVIFLTATTDTKGVIDGFAAGGVDYVQKPIREAEVVARVNTHIQTRVLIGELRAANEAKNRFLGMASHDLRNPLASIRGLAQFLKDPIIGKLTPDQLDMAETIETTANGMLSLVNELLDVATIESGELKLNPEMGSLKTLVEKVVSLANLDATRKKTKLVLVIANDIPDMLFDEAKMRQVAENLFSNAVKYSPPGSTIRIVLRDSETAQNLHVIDQGPGIPAGEADKLFKDFGRLSVQPTGGEKSTGLGLAICRKIVQAHDGTISAENLATGGCVFKVSLPKRA
ncbi:hybrid sensor histidine kinase/response regulator [Synoicihabitans lomoniglobus]|uniref:histidine kinase n=1 Tax=Synoicihabitans lomoniglobus TaxID=2909285 RepID=A0AAF0CRX0_9BACT|nr:hybrid sensor histidine kinase/response regulator [Opitutaceae bacterium LMO-M01]WED66925.1 hybrid sensor histidine kinase/response regulator [Opitutaceae bacterium LMO-M01]